MTTLAYKNGVLAFDSRISTEDGVILGSAIKAFKLKTGELIALAGQCDHCQVAKQWALSGFKDNADKKALDTIVKPCYTMVRIIKRNKLFFYDDSTNPYTYNSDTYAWGSGWQFAMGRMVPKNSTAVEGVRAAAKFDAHTGGRIHTLTLGARCTKKNKRS